ncbi:WecB/TagA/CpsF family glycosyltransferase [Roseinatronobacter sp. HJB301]|uniref:WecB/TagA/CpsF family glycosyltransferase n=2 Tax=Roseinatronobacter alkalisoli TaxID=3028235 RepID=A0ABT5T8X4_9RHOB|nr:WecB/TagA/CpsF family glycosyltransferase [Roseinatronobacter sp. HJB301]
MSQQCHPVRDDGNSTDVLIRLFGLPLLSASEAQAVGALLGRAKCRAAFVNAHCVNVAYRNPAYRRALDSADLLLPDGAGIDLAARWQGARLAANLNGTDLCPLLLAEAARRGLSVFLLGGQAGVAADAANALSRSFPDLRIAGTLDGFAQATPEVAIPTINDSGADILLVAMGVPLQDLWLAQYAPALRPRLVMGVGALFDFLAGRVRRAPRWIRRIRMEWAWRLAMEPRRMFGRYVIGNLVFLWRARRAARLAKTGQDL